MSDQRMNAGDQGSQPDSGSNPNDQVAVDGQGSAQDRGGQGSYPEGSSDLGNNTNISLNDVTEQAHRKGQTENKDKA